MDAGSHAEMVPEDRITSNSAAARMLDRAANGATCQQVLAACQDGPVAKLVTWSQYREAIGDRSGLFEVLLAGAWPVERALYPGSYVDLSPSTAIRSVTYVDTDARAARFFADAGLVRAQLTGRCRPGAEAEVRFLAADYTQALDVREGSMDLLISLFAGPV